MVVGELAAELEIVARAMFERAEDQYQKYAAMKISGPKNPSSTSRRATDKVLKKQLLDKAKALQEIEATYAAIINTGAGEWGVAALVRLGMAYENMADTLRNSYIPNYLTEDQRELYVMALEDKVYPQEQKAVEAYSKALEKSFELSLYNENTAYAVRRLAELRPDDFPALEEELLQPTYLTTPTHTADFETEM